ncbi:DEAD/DEAH box helicase family protein [Streptomyces sp. G-G2]|uniref:DEAD/DEAH box helicase family protein n=1 Tax=Streptomyces sp. G-G2 TaxID=3046201 RepID=UPI0024BB8C0E|nr:DEAD/DEAH box helicase family protein [Streptomyces sp. G-G2]MDJ0386013.1 DEAD/DEAH box helicase family protein [Streptomyces sp. G-G2]
MTTDHARKSAAREQVRITGESYLRAAVGAAAPSPEVIRSTGRQFVLSGFCGSFAGVVRNRHWLVDVYPAQEGRGLPRGLAPFEAPLHSWERFVQGEINHEVLLPRPQGGTALPLRDYQQEQVARLVAARREGAPGYLWALPTGSGKTPMAVRAVCAAAGRAPQKILVVTRLSVVPAWRATIDRFATSGHRWVVINPERLWRLLDHPEAGLHRLPGDEAAKLVAQEGVSRVDWDTVVIDECHMLANSESRRARTVQRLMARSDGGQAFAIWASATPFTEPEESAYLGNLVAHAAGVRPPAGEVDYRLWLKELGLRLNNDRRGRWYHRFNRPDVTRLRALLYESGVGSAATASDLNLPEQERDVQPIVLSEADRVRYERAWEEFRRSEGLSVFADSSPGSYRVEALRKVQKASLVKAPYVARIVVDQVRRGCQVVVPMWFVESIDEVAVRIARELRAAGLDERVVAITGRDVELRERKRVAFQRGEALVVVLNALEGINLHAGEANTDGKGGRATSTPRVSVIADVLTGGKRALQAEGRTQRDGRSAPVIYAYAAGTGEAQWTAATFRSLSNTLSLSTNDRDSAAFACLADHITLQDTT